MANYEYDAKCLYQEFVKIHQKIYNLKTSFENHKQIESFLLQKQLNEYCDPILSFKKYYLIQFANQCTKHIQEHSNLESFFTDILTGKRFKSKHATMKWDMFLLVFSCFCRSLKPKDDQDLLDLISFSTIPSLFNFFQNNQYEEYSIWNYISFLWNSSDQNEIETPSKNQSSVLFFFSNPASQFLDRLEFIRIFSRPIFVSPLFLQFVHKIFAPIISNARSMYYIMRNSQQISLTQNNDNIITNDPNDLMESLHKALIANISLFPSYFSQFLWILNEKETKERKDENESNSKIVYELFYYNFLKPMFKTPRDFYLIDSYESDTNENNFFDFDGDFQNVLRDWSPKFVKTIIDHYSQNHPNSHIIEKTTTPASMILDSYDIGVINEILSINPDDKSKSVSSVVTTIKNFISNIYNSKKTFQYEIFNVNLVHDAKNPSQEINKIMLTKDFSSTKFFSALLKSIRMDETKFSHMPIHLVGSLLFLLLSTPALPILDCSNNANFSPIEDVVKPLFLKNNNEMHLSCLANLDSYKKLLFPQQIAQLNNLFENIANIDISLSLNFDNLYDHFIVVVYLDIFKLFLINQFSDENSDNIFDLHLFRNAAKITSLLTIDAKNCPFRNYLCNSFPQNSPSLIQLATSSKETTEFFNLLHQCHTTFNQLFDDAFYFLHNSFHQHLTYYKFLMINPQIISKDMEFVSKINQKSSTVTDFFQLPESVNSNSDRLYKAKQLLSDLFKLNEIPLKKAWLLSNAFDTIFDLFNIQQIHDKIEVISFIVFSLHLNSFVSNLAFCVQFIQTNINHYKKSKLDSFCILFLSIYYRIINIIDSYENKIWQIPFVNYISQSILIYADRSNLGLKYVNHLLKLIYKTDLLSIINQKADSSKISKQKQDPTLIPKLCTFQVNSTDKSGLIKYVDFVDVIITKSFKQWTEKLRHNYDKIILLCDKEQQNYDFFAAFNNGNLCQRFFEITPTVIKQFTSATIGLKEKNDSGKNDINSKAFTMIDSNSILSMDLLNAEY